ncbi:hypothetical protein HWV07_17745 [Natronomonas salina]|uniref:ATP-grasp fold amidoligase family protein n=1 Tax=Natronomonas salina TaxID=1710540 RepID=UPI0015B78430|nr:ATP-grasp fold amidoligase family protein [Natronomonas salina]QLD90786.1 hypothetical protein HWV07_17745 [Natronomonas salina]
MLQRKAAILKDSLLQEGPLAALKRIANHILIHNPASPYLKAALGKELHLKLFMYLRLGYWPQIKNPRTFNEKVAHRKLYEDNELFSTVEDKWQVRDYVAEKVGEDFLPELYHVTDDPEDIPFDELPESFVVKPNHMAGPIIFVEEGDTVPREEIKAKGREWLETTHNVMKEESWYWDIEPRILFEEYLQNEDDDVPPDYKFFVFHGEVEYVQVDLDRYSDHKRRFYDRDWNPQEFKRGYPLAPVTEKPDTFDDMVEIAETLGEDLDFIRIDLYDIDGERIAFGEMTVGPGSGVGDFEPEEIDHHFGELW